MTWDSTWEEVFQKREWGKYPDVSVVRFVARQFYRVANRSDVKLLEIGCGPGANVWFMAREGFDVTGIDGSETAIERAKSRMERESLKANLVLDDIMQLRIETGSIDAVLDVECLCCNRAKAATTILHEVARVLKPGGLLYSQTFADDMYVGATQEVLGHLEFNGISDGPLAGLGVVRLIDFAGIQSLYGEEFEIISVDKQLHTQNNQSSLTSEWLVIAQRRS
jgi:2-polyprenyl-3-methyl-5-hydroxy-6-metoxy-1,4-benzoquinol methylase